MYDKDLALEHANYLTPAIEAVKKGHTTLKDVSIATGIGIQRLSVYFVEMAKYFKKKGYISENNDKSSRVACVDFIQSRFLITLIQKHKRRLHILMCRLRGKRK